MNHNLREAFIKSIQHGGPVAAAGSLAGTTIILASIFTFEGHTDVIIAVGAVLIVLAFVEWALGRRFAAHVESEKLQRDVRIEGQKSMYAAVVTAALEPLSKEMNRMVMVFDGNSATNERQYREFQKMRESVEKIQEEFHKMSSLKLEERVAAIERSLKIRA